MAVYLIADIKVTDDAWVPDYTANVHAIVHKHGGKYLSRSANTYNKDDFRRHPALKDAGIRWFRRKNETEYSTCCA